MQPEIFSPLKRTSRPAVPRPAIILAGAVLLSVGLFLITAVNFDGPGFPLDDAWIHQTYARSLAQTGQWSYLPGQPSAGSTAPLWSLLLAGGYLLRLDPLAWAYALGAAALLALAAAGECLFRSLNPLASTPLPLAGLFLAFEWHMVWAAGSGMETVLYAALVLAVLLWSYHAKGRQWLGVGALVGLGVWVRPDALTLLGPAVFIAFFSSPAWKGRLAALVWISAGFALLFAPYLAFNWSVQGALLPNTFFAKQAEYAALLETPLLTRYLDLLSLPLVGGGLFLLPGFLYFLFDAARARKWEQFAPALWFLGFVLVYALRLPVMYQYGRYIMPAMPVYFVLGLLGSAGLWALARGKWGWMLQRFWLFSLTGITLVFFASTASYYSRDVAIINQNMVAAAKWVNANTPEDAVIAAHDIGALGYFGHRRLVDLAGLISPEVIPFMRDEAALSRWLDDQDVDYLVTFELWYQRLPEGKEAVFEAQSSLSRGDRMVVYRWK